MSASTTKPSRGTIMGEEIRQAHQAWKNANRQLYTVKEVAGLLSLSVRQVQRMVKRGELVPCSFGYRTHRIPAFQIDALIKERTLGGAE